MTTPTTYPIKFSMFGGWITWKRKGYDMEDVLAAAKKEIIQIYGKLNGIAIYNPDHWA